jgi:tRNA threonylcarbamoyladenosine biosynthesis protein TsaE
VRVEVVSTSPADTARIAQALAARLRPGDVVLVEGEIGAGKTTFVRGACRALGIEQPVTSPTFTIGHRYCGVHRVSHLDLYRFQGLSPAEWGDLEPYFDDAIVFVEWPREAEGALPPARLRVVLEHDAPERRRIALDSADPLLLEGLEGADPRVRHGD